MSKKSDEDIQKYLDETRQELQEMSKIFTENAKLTPEERAAQLKKSAQAIREQERSTAKADKVLGRGGLSAKAEVLTGMHVKDQQPKKLTRLQRLIKKLGIDKLFSKARGGNLFSRPSASPNKKDPEQGQGVGK